MAIGVQIEDVLNQIGCQVIHIWNQAPKEPSFRACPSMHPELKKLVQNQFPSGLYSHQAIAVDSALRGDNVVIATSTASGKTVAFALPLLNSLLQEPDATAILFYPTKALAADQLEKLTSYCQDVGLGNVVYRFDGDIQGNERKLAIRNGRIFLSTPDILHKTMLKGNRGPFSTFFDRLKFVVLDECHTYTGAFGSNMAFLMRRLRQVCRAHGSAPQFLAASATTFDPGVHMHRLTGLDFTVIGEDMNGSPSGGRRYLVVNPPSPEGYLISATQLVSELIRLQRRFLVFCHSRKTTEQQFKDLVESDKGAIGRVMPYRSGFEPTDRAMIEQSLRSGQILGVYSTSALELGVDLPEMEYCIMAGIPATAMSFWQRAGRVGRKPGAVGTVVIFPSENPIDEFYRRYPERLFDRPLEELVVHLDNRKLVLSHFACARAESADFDNPNLDEDIFGQDFVQLARMAKEQEISEDDVLFSPEPHAITDLRCVDDPSFDISTGTGSGRIGTIAWSQLLREAHPQAVYLHMGESYRVERVLFREREVRIRPEPRRELSTSPTGYIEVKARPEILFRRMQWGTDLALLHTGVLVTTYTTGYRERNKASWVNQETFPQPLMRRVRSEGVWLQFGPAFGKQNLSGLNSLAHALVNIYSLIQPCDVHEVSTYSVQQANDGCPRLYMFDTTSGGLAISSRAFDVFGDLLEKAEDLLQNCSYCHPGEDAGCPSCIQVPRWYEDNTHLSKSLGLALLQKVREVMQSSAPLTYVTPIYEQRMEGGLTSVAVAPEPEEAVEQTQLVTVWTPGSKAFTRNGAEATTMEAFLTGESREIHYRVQLGERTLTVPANALTFAAGQTERWCRACGARGLEMEDTACPVCGAQ